MADKNLIIEKHWENPLLIGGVKKLQKGISKMMEEYATEKMVELVENISRQPIQCYSQKVTGKDKEFFLGRSFVEDLKKRLKSK